METLRLDKLLCAAAGLSRREAKQRIQKGQVCVNNRICKNPDEKVQSDAQITLNAEPVCYARFEYYMLNKAAGCVCANRDRKYPTVLDAIDSPRKDDLFAVGRLDLDTEGLLLITNDGDLAHCLLSPKKHVDKTYYARIAGAVTQEDVDRFAQGMKIGEKNATLPAKLEILSSGAVSEVYVTIREGKFHQIKRMFAQTGKEVQYLKRIRMGTLTLDPALETGAYRPLKDEEVEQLKEGGAHD